MPNQSYQNTLHFLHAHVDIFSHTPENVRKMQCGDASSLRQGQQRTRSNGDEPCKRFSGWRKFTERSHMWRHFKIRIRKTMDMMVVLWQPLIHYRLVFCLRSITVLRVVTSA